MCIQNANIVLTIYKLMKNGQTFIEQSVYGLPRICMWVGVAIAAQQPL